MTALPFPDGQAELFLSYSGLHMLEEIARCLKHGGQVVGTTFLAEGARRSRACSRSAVCAATRTRSGGRTCSAGSPGPG